jgi:putative chitinase
MLNVGQLQTRLGVTADRVLGPGTLGALFRRFGAGADIAAELGLAGNVHLRTYGILDTGLRLAHFLAQVAHESAGFRYMEEIWGPTPQQKGYEGRADLGNIQPGDGRRYQGRGPIQLTGRANYRTYGRALGFDFERHPEIVALPSVGMLVACRYWSETNLGVFADADDINTITRRINGGTNGLSERRSLLVKAKGLIL